MLASAAWGAPVQPTYGIPDVRSVIATPTFAIPPGPRVAPFETAYQIPRTIGFADFNGDGYLDMFLAPGFSQHETYVPVEVWLNRGNGTFYNATSELIEGLPPLTWGAVEVLIGDFNEDGRPDVVILSTGGEHAVADGDPNAGYNNKLLLSQPNGKYRDASANIPFNSRAFNHNGGSGDANGDGHLDLVIVDQTVTLADGDGVKLFYGDGKGGFVDATSRLPEEVRFMPWNERPGDLVFPNFEYQMVGCAALADLDGDGRAEVITGTYNTPDRGPNGTRTVRFHKMGAGGNFIERGRVTIPDALASIPFDTAAPPPPKFQGLGCPQILAGDLDGDGRTDLVVTWEGNGSWYVEVLRNDGDFKFTDITLDALGSYEQGFPNGGGRMGPGHYRLVDINGDGALDLVPLNGGLNTDVLTQHLGWLNDGAGHFTPWQPRGPTGILTTGQVVAAAKCGSCNYLPLVFDTNRSGLASLVLMDFQSSASTGTPAQTTAVYLTNFMPTGSAAPFLPVVEFYNAGLDHYFITRVAAEIANLDAGTTIKGWTRTGKMLRSYTAAQPGAAPVCRFYIPPGLGDSHFFGRGTVECNDTGRKNPSFVLEDAAFMHMLLPSAGTCPANSTPIYRVFDSRPDANHRYTTEKSVRDQMVAKGWLAEGDGPDLVVMCAPL